MRPPGNSSLSERKALEEKLRFVRSFSSNRETPYTDVELFLMWRIVSLPSTSGSPRQEVRDILSTGEVADTVRRELAFGTDERRCVIVLGSKSIPESYVRMLLATTASTGGVLDQCVIVSRKLLELGELAKTLSPEFGPRILFVRTDVPFFFHRLVPPSSCSAVVFPHPQPFPLRTHSHCRLLTSDVMGLIHAALQTRVRQDDPRGFVVWTDSQQYRDFAVGQLEQSKLLFGWAKKTPSVFDRYIPETVRADRTLSLVAAAKSAPTPTMTPFSFSYQRRYYDAFQQPSTT